MNNRKLAALVDTFYVEATVEQLQAALQKGDVTSEQLVQMAHNRVSRFNETLKALMEWNPEAEALAVACDRERQLGNVRSPLHGIPVIIKDNINTGDRMKTSAGSAVLANFSPGEDAFLVKQLRQAGAIIIGKANMTEWANFMAYEMPSGYSSRGGQTLNPYGPFDVGGSSSGCGAAVAAGFAPLAVGTETSGSILSPASSNSLVGLKPTVGLVSRTGIIPITFTQDTAGPMTKTVKDAAYLLEVLVGVDERDVLTKVSAGRATNYVAACHGYSLTGKTIVVCREPYFTYGDESELAVLNEAIATLRRLGATVIDDVVMPNVDIDLGYETLLQEFKPALESYFQTYNAPVQTLAELIALHETDEERYLKYDQQLLLDSEAAEGLASKAYVEARERDIYYTRDAGIDLLLAEHHADCYVFPNNYGASHPAKAGYPSLTVPAGYTENGQPVGLTFAGLPYSEALLFEIAYVYEQSTRKRVAPMLSEV